MALESYMGGPPTSYMGPEIKYSPSAMPSGGANLIYDQAPDNRSEFGKGVSRGVDSLQMMGLGALGMGADIVGADRAKEYFYQQAQEQQKQIEQSPAAVGQFTDIASAGDLGKWFMGAVGEALPSSAASFIGSGAGALIFRAAAAKLASNAALKGILANQVEKAVISGVARQEAEKQVMKEFFKTEIQQQALAQASSRGAYAGAMTIGSGMESGSNWIDDVEKNTMQGTNPVRDLLFGIAGGAVESGLGAERRLVGKLAAQKAEGELTKLAGRGIVKNVGAELVKSMGGEGSEEFVQQMLNQAAVMRNASLEDMLYAKQDWKSNLNAGMAGAAGGVLFGAVGGTRDHLGSRGYKASQTDPNSSQGILEQKQTALATAGEYVQGKVSQYDQAIQQVNDQRSKLARNIMQINGTVRDVNQREQLINQVETQWMELSAQHTKLVTEKEQLEKEAKSKLESISTKYDMKALEASTQEQMDAPKSIQEIKARALEAERSAVGLAAIDSHAQREIDKADKRIEQHQTAIEQLNDNMAKTRIKGGIIGNENVELLKWHEQQIADERRFAKNVLSEYNQAKDTKSTLPTSSLFDLYRNNDHATNLMAAKYQDTTKGIADNVLSTEIKTRRDANIGKETSLLERLNSKREQNGTRNAAANSIDGMTAAILAANRRADINNKLQDYRQKQMQVVTHNIVADQMRMPNTGVVESGTMPLSSNNMQAELNRLITTRKSGRPTGPAVQPAGYQTLQNNRRFAEAQRQREIADAQRQGAKMMYDAQKAQEKIDKAAYQKTSMDQNQARNEGLKRRTVSWISNTLEQLSALKNVVKVVHSDELHTLPDYVQEGYSGKGAALIDLKSGTIYLFADKFHNKQHAVRTLLHEGVAHFGLRSIMTPEQLDKFLHMVAREFIGTDSWQEVAKFYPEYDTFSIAEEYVARYAEQIRLNDKTLTKAKLMFEKVKSFFRGLLEQLGLVKVTDQDIKDVLLASVYNLTQGKNEKQLRENVLGHGDTNYRGVAEVNYAGFYSPLQRFVASINVNPNKPMPAKFWLDHIFPKGQLRQGLNEEEMQYYKDQMGGMTVKQYLEGWSADDAPYQLTKTDLMKALAGYFDQVGIEEVVQEGNKVDNAKIKRLQKDKRDAEKALVEMSQKLSPDDTSYLVTELDAYSNNLGQFFAAMVDSGGTTFLPITRSDLKSILKAFYYMRNAEFLPGDVSPFVQKFMTTGNKYLTAHDDIIETSNGKKVPFSESNLVTENSTNHRNFIVTAPALEDFTEGHTFGDKDTNDTIFWIRTSDIKDSDGNKVLHIEEVQSDRIQAGVEVDKKTGKPKKGFAPLYRSSDAEVERIHNEASKEYEAELDRIQTKYGIKFKEEQLFDPDSFHTAQVDRMISSGAIPTLVGDTITRELRKASTKYQDALDVGNDLRNQFSGAIPYTPLVQGYNLLAIKRMIAFAAENGYDKVSWTSGEAQIDRWTNDLRANVESISWEYTLKLSREEKMAKQIEANSLLDSAKNALMHIQDDYKPGSNTHGVIQNTLHGFLSADHAEMIDLIDVLKSTQPYVDTVFKPWRKAQALLKEINAPESDNLALDVVKKNGTRTELNFVDGVYDGKELEEVVGKDMAKKIMSEQSGKLEGEGLSIGGQGFIKVYDGEMVNQANRYLKNLDPSVRVTDLPFAGYKMHSFPVTELMKQKIENGQPVYGRTLFESRDVAPSGEWRNVRESRDYKEHFENSKNWFTELMAPTNSIIKDGKIILSEKPTFREKTLVALHDTFYPVLNLQKMVELNGGKIPIAANVYEAEKTSHNEIANEFMHFTSNIVGIDLQNPAARPAEGTLFYKIAQIPGLPPTAKGKLEAMGLILQAYHAEEANRVLAAKSVDKVQLQKVENRIERLKNERKQGQGNLSVKAAMELDKQISIAENLREKILDVKEDLYGMSNERAEQIKAQYKTEQNAGQILEIIKDVQNINKMIMDKAVAEGLLDPRLRKFFDETYAFYVPNTKWESVMRQVIPSYGTGASAINMGLWEYTKERTGTDTLGSNPIISLVMKMENLIKAAAEKKKGTALHNLYMANSDQLSEVMEQDNRREINEYTAQLKNLTGKIEKLLVDSKTGNTREIIKGLQKRILELKVDQSKQVAKLATYTSIEARVKADKKLMQIELDLQNAKDGVAAMRTQQEALKNNQEYKTLEQQRKDLINARKALYDQRGFKAYVTTNSLGQEVIKWKKNPSKFTGQMAQVITLFDENNNKVRYLIKNVHLLAALKGTHVFKTEAVIRFLGKMQRYMAQLYTTFSPAFIMVNAIRDFVTANIHIRHLAEDIPSMNISRSELSKAYVAHWAPALKHMYALARDGKVTDPYWAAKIEAFQKNGGYTSMYNLGNWTNAEKALTHSMKRAMDNKRSGKEAMYATMNWMQDASNAVENSSRLAAFAIISDQLIKNGMSEADAHKMAATASLDLTVNFTKRGTWSPIISSLFLFSQASINSSVRIARAMFPASDKSKPFHQRRISKYLTGLMMVGILAGMLCRAGGGDDDDGVPYYDKIPEATRNSSLHIPVGKNTFIKIPVAFGYQAFFTLGGVLGDLMMGRTTKAAALNSVFTSGLNNFSFIGGGNEDLVMSLTPTMFKPLAQVASNKNFFGGSVYPESKSWEKGDKPDSQKAWKNTSNMFKWMAEVTNEITGGSKDRAGLIDVSPATMEHVVRQYLGGLGDIFVKTASIGQKVISGKTPDIEMNNIPIISRFATQSTYENTLHEYTKIKKEIETQLAEYKRAKDERVGPTELIEVMNATAKGRLLEKRLAAVQEQMAKVSKEENKMISSPSISEEAKYNRMQLNEKRNENVIKAFIKTAHSAGVK